jgi:hypothetical protein
VLARGTGEGAASGETKVRRQGNFPARRCGDASVRRLNTRGLLTLLGLALARRPVPHLEKLSIRDPIGVGSDPAGYLGPQPHPSEMMLHGTFRLSTAKVLSSYWEKGTGTTGQFGNAREV